MPVTRRSALWTTTPEANGAPLERWQSLQWQLSMATGALEQVKRTAPHAHPPDKGSFTGMVLLALTGPPGSVLSMQGLGITASLVPSLAIREARNAWPRV